MKEQLKQNLNYIKSLGFIVNDEEKIIGYLKQVGFYRLRKYFNVFKDKNVDFQRVIDLYLFDKNLRNLSLNIIECVEFYIKNLFILTFGKSYDDKDLYGDKYLESRMKFIEEKKEELLNDDLEVKNIFKKTGKITSEVFINKLTFGQIVRLIQDLKKENKLVFANNIGLKLKLLENRLDCLAYLRNICSHGENIFNKKMVKYVKSKDIINKIGMENRNRYISYFMILSIFKDLLIPTYEWEAKVFEKMKQYNVNLCYFGENLTKKEVFPNELESEAWKTLITPLYSKTIKKSN